ncbi:sigma-E factor negative regulatory protein [uncultured Porticoccus sp.]|uniref:sigma-E factor negative regulatory protein n=1 Tax=Porticoccus sp. TaxID=2024853 RepID=UPI0030D942F2|tara:strand:+ start:7369 stop:8028 length:660 start_codon:yes stop_codon:yes gene_type:complete
MTGSTDREKESLSALMDGQADELEVHRVLKSISGNNQSRDTWRRYQMAAAAMRRDLPEQVVDYSASISAALENEKALQVNTLSARMLKPLGRFAIAASVATVAIIGFQQYNMPDTHQPVVASTKTVDNKFSPAQLRTSADFGIPSVTARTVSVSNNPESYRTSQSQPVIVVDQATEPEVTREQVQAYLNSLMIEHTGHAAMNTNQGMLPFARMPTTHDQ